MTLTHLTTIHTQNYAVKSFSATLYLTEFFLHFNTHI